MPLVPEINTASVVLVGHFNPLIFRPEWFGKKGILTDKEVTEAEVEVVLPEVVAFGIKPWIRFVVEQQKFSATVMQDPIIKLFDFVLGCFSHLPETPVSKLGINREMHFSLGTEQKWHALGDKLAPKEPWGDFTIGADGKRKGGLLSVLMQQKPRDDGFKGEMNINVRPSTNIKFGVHCQVNDHYDLAEDNTLKDAREAIEILKKQWDTSMTRAEGLINRIVN